MTIDPEVPSRFDLDALRKRVLGGEGLVGGGEGLVGGEDLVRLLARVPLARAEPNVAHGESNSADGARSNPLIEYVFWSAHDDDPNLLSFLTKQIHDGIFVSLKDLCQQFLASRNTASEQADNLQKTRLPRMYITGTEDCFEGVLLEILKNAALDQIGKDSAVSNCDWYSDDTFWAYVRGNISKSDFRELVLQDQARSTVRLDGLNALRELVRNGLSGSSPAAHGEMTPKDSAK